MTRRTKFWVWTGGSIAAILILLTIGSLRVLTSPWFENYLRAKIVSLTEDSTGGKVDIGAFQFDGRHLRATIDNFVLHGREAPPDMPLFSAKRIELRLKLFAGLKKAIDLEYLGIERPSANVIVFPDGRTNIPEPKTVSQSSKSALETIVDLAIQQFEISNGSATFAQQSIGFSGRGQNLQVELLYHPAPAGYRGNIKIGSLQLMSRGGEPVSASVELPLEIGSDTVELKNASIATPGSRIAMSASLSHVSAPVIDAHVIAQVSLVELQRATGWAMDACKKSSTPCYGEADVEARIDPKGVQISKASLKAGRTDLEATGVKPNISFNATLDLDELGRLFRVHAEPRGELTLNGSAQLQGTSEYSLNARVAGQGIAVGSGSDRLENVALSSELVADPQRIELHKLRVGVLGGEVEGDGSLAGYSTFQFSGQLRSLRIRDLERAAAGPPAAGARYDGRLDGEIDAAGDLKKAGSTGIRGHAKIRITSAGVQSQDVRVSGNIQAGYDGSQDTIQIGPSQIVLPHSRLDLSGILGDSIALKFSSMDLDDLYPALVMSSKEPPKEMPVRLNGGTLGLRAEVTGPLRSPRIAAHMDADRFSVGKRPFDRLSADVSASSASAGVMNGSLVHQSLQAQFSGSLGLRQWSPQNDSPITLALDMRQADIADMLALAGEAQVPAKGAADADVRLSGTIGNPQGALHLMVANGEAYSQPFDKVDANIDLRDQLVRLASLEVTAQMAHLQATGTYSHPRESLATGRAQVHLNGAGIQLGQIAALEKQHPGITGGVQLQADVTGDIRQSSGTSEFVISGVQGSFDARGLRDNKQNYGDLDARADTSGSNVNFNLTSNLAGAAIKIVGRTALTKDYATTADASIQNLRIENAVALAGEQLPARGLLALTGRISGTAKDPSADVQLTLTSANFYGEPVDRLESTLRYSNTRIEIPSLRLATPAGSVTLNGSFSHQSGDYNAGKIEMHAQGDNLQLAKIQNIQAKRPGVAGTLKFMADFAGEVKAQQGGHDFSISKADTSLAATGIAYKGSSYGDASLVTTSKGDSVAFNANSNFGGASIRGEGEAKLQADYPVTAKLTLANVRYSALREWLGDSSTNPGFEALLEAQTYISGPAKKPEEMKGKLELTRLELSSLSRGAASSAVVMELKNDGPMILDYDHGSMRIQNAHLTGKSTDILIAGTANFNAANPLNITVKADSNLALLQDISKDIRASGAVAVDASVRGTFSQPLANGTVQLKNASVNLESLSNGISNANGTVTLNGSRATTRNLTAESGGGKIAVTGSASLIESNVRYSLNVKADHVRTRYQGISLVNSATLTLAGASDRSLLNGNVTVERVAYNPQSDIGSILSQLTQREPPDVSSGISRTAAAMRLDVRMRTSPAVRFDTTMAQALRADADLNLTGTLQQPGLLGAVNVTEGDLIFFGNEYTVDRGTITFTDPTKIDPRLSVDLETTVESVTVTLGVTGPMNNLKLSYHSDPPLRFDEIVGLLATGKQPTSDPNIVANQAAPPQQSVGEMGESAIVSQAVASPLASRLQRVFGVSQLHIDPTFANGSALPEARLTLQQRVANTVTFTYSQDLSQSNSELIRVEWAVSPKFSAVATRDENGIFGVDFFYKRQYR